MLIMIMIIFNVVACESLKDLFPAGATDVLPPVRCSYPPQLQDFITWPWSTRAECQHKVPNPLIMKCSQSINLHEDSGF